MQEINNLFQIPEGKIKFLNREYHNNFPMELIRLFIGYTPKICIEFGSFDCGEAIAFKTMYGGQTYSIEADPSLFNQMTMLEPLGFKVFNYAVGGHDDINVEFHRTKYNNRMWGDITGYSGSGSILKPTQYAEDVNIHQDYLKEPVLVEMITIDTFCKNNKILNIDFMNIDTEGYIIPILAGMDNVRPRMINVEIDAVIKYYNGADRFEEVNTVLEHMGYGCKLRTVTDSIFVRL